ncbi:hypothetical protein OPS25_05650 [Alteromonas ponticola]|uniref:Lipoprotein n=1 Tax=Alteromonas aquimaris TaxID=2998417 RepID=A0ABT3P5D4_9ALTE|nr:hypothetical protein [Alteromonas aquimaris]MCW8107977.1 hypothetical protein [Alteromonas aquimaris]
MKFITLVSMVALTLSATVCAETIEEALVNCSKVENSLQRLMCFDKVVKDVKQYSGVEAAVKRGYAVPGTAAQNDAAPRPAPRHSFEATTVKSAPTPFGLEAKEQTEEVEEITSTVAKIDKAPRGELIITLSDDAVWRQRDDKHYKLKVGDVVKIERGMLGSFYLSKPDQNTRIKVKRTK